MEGFIMLMVVVWLLAAVMTAEHASGQDKSPVLWFFVVAIGGVLGLVVYAVSLASD